MKLVNLTKHEITLVGLDGVEVVIPPVAQPLGIAEAFSQKEEIFEAYVSNGQYVPVRLLYEERTSAKVANNRPCLPGVKYLVSRKSIELSPNRKDFVTMVTMPQFMNECKTQRIRQNWGVVNL